MQKSLLLLAFGAIPLFAAAQGSGGAASVYTGADVAPPLFACVENGKSRYGHSASDGPGGCRPLAPLPANWRWMGVRSERTEANYVDLHDVTRRGDAIAVWVLVAKPDSSGAVFGGPETFGQFDFKAHRFIDCATRQSWLDEVQLIRGVRTTGEIVKAAKGAKPAPKPIVNDSTDAQIAAVVCDGGHPRATLP